jgi:small subunit ribosomal protein S1
MSEIPKRPNKPEKDEKLASEDYDRLLDHYQFSAKDVTAGKIVKGRIVKVTPSHVLVL